MQTAILLQPPMLATSALPTCFADPVDEAATREWLAHPHAPRRLVAIAPGTRFDDAVARALGIDAERTDAVAVVYLASHALLDRGDVDALGIAEPLAASMNEADQRADEAIERAMQDFEAGDWKSAEPKLAELDEHLGNEPSPRHARVLVGLGEIARLQGRTAEAKAALDRALSMDPSHDEALRARSAIARSTGEHAIAAAMLHRLVDSLDRSVQRFDVLSTIASESLEAARDATLQALELRPGDRELLQRRRIIAELAGNWDDAVTVEVQLAEAIEDPEERARAFVAAADLCRARTKKKKRAIALYEAAVEDDPKAEGAFARVEASFIDAKDYQGAARAYERQIARLAAIEPDDDERLDLLRRLAQVSFDQLGDSQTAIRALDEVATMRPEDIEARVLLARLLDEIGQTTLAVRCLELAAEFAPFRAATYRDLHRMLGNEEDEDRAYSAAAALVALGEADLDEQMAYAQFAPESPLRPNRTFDEAFWAELAPDHHDADVDAIMAAIENAAVAAWIEAQEERSGLPSPDDKYKQDPETTTVSAVRSFLWASRLLGVSQPTVYAQPQNSRIGVLTVPSRSDEVLLGRHVLTGRSSVELSFIAAHHMTYFRPGWKVISYFPTFNELQTVARAAVAVARPDVIAEESLGAGTLELSQRMSPHLGETARAELAVAIDRIYERGSRMDLASWMRSVESTACRAALVATGDVTIAGNLLAVAGGPVADMTARDRARDLLPFSVSQKYGELRRGLGVSVGRGS